jgi:hypothetical protein
MKRAALRYILAMHNPKLHSLLQELNNLTDKDQQALVILINSLVKRAQMNRVLAA